MATIDRIKYDGPTPDLGGRQVPWLVYKHPSETLKLGSQLVVHQSQEAVFYKHGAARDVFGPGTHTLSTYNLPLLWRLVNLPFGGDTPFTAEVYFVNKVAKLDMKWGTKTPFTVQEPKYNTIVRVRAYGQFGIRVANSSSFITQIVGALHGDQVSDYQRVSDYFRGLVLSKVQDSIAKEVRDQRASVFDLAGSLTQLSSLANDRVRSELDRFGIEVLNFYTESINFPEEDLKILKETMARRAELDVLGDRYREKRGFDVLEKAAENPGGAAGVMAGLGAGLGAGVAVGGAMADAAKGSILSHPNVAGALVRCPDCGKEGEPGAKFCSGCGRSLASGKCPKCNTDLAPGAKFCSNCGSSLAGAKCPKCQTETTAGAKFCGNCGQELA